MPPHVQARWVQFNNGQVPPNAVEGGYQQYTYNKYKAGGVVIGYQEDNKTFVGRALHDGQLVPGEVFLGGSTVLLRLAIMALLWSGNDLDE